MLKTLTAGARYDEPGGGPNKRNGVDLYKQIESKECLVVCSAASTLKPEVSANQR